MKLFIILGFPAMLAVLATQCAPGGHHEDGGHHHLLSLLASMEPDSLHLDMNRLNNLDSSKLVEIHKRVEGAESFLIPTRLDKVTSQPCLSCHNQPLAVLQAKSDAEKKRSHWQIELIHAKAETLQCNTCHDTQDFSYLKSLTGGRIEFNHSYKLCGQCHSDQYKDWEGGAHGKQVGGWAPPRVSETCVGCHNPHKPSFEKRLPSRLNTAWLEQKKNK